LQFSSTAAALSIRDPIRNSISSTGVQLYL
jgi:hypothetical protein